MDIVVQVAVFDIGIQSPYFGEELFPCKGLSGIADEELEKFIFFFGQAAFPGGTV